MSPFLFSADHAVTEIGRHARATTLVSDLRVMSISDLFADYAAARSRGDLDRMRQIRVAAGQQMAAELDGFDYPAAA